MEPVRPAVTGTYGTGRATPVAIGPELALLHEITQTINLGRSVEEVFDLLDARLRGRIPYDRAAIALLDPTGELLQVISVRPAGRSSLPSGYTGRLAGSGLEDLILGGRPRVIDDFERAAATGVRGDSTRLILRDGFRSGLLLPLLIEGKPIGMMFLLSRSRAAYRAEHVEFLCAIAGHMAIAIEKSRLLEALQAKTRYLENIVQSSADAIVMVAADGRITGWNEGARRSFGWEPEEALGRTWRELVGTDLPSGAGASAVQERLARDGFVVDLESACVAKDGRRLVVHLTCTRMTDASGSPAGATFILRDVSHTKRLEEDLVRSQSLASLGELAAMVAHEIKNPLAGISGAVQVLGDAIPKQDPRRAVVGEILGQIDRLDHIVRDLLAFARPTVPARQRIDLVEGLWGAWSRVGREQHRAAVRFVLDVPGPTTLEADPEQLQEVWVHLFQNAVEAMPTGGELRVRVIDGAVVRIEVRDSGAGIETAQLDKVFQPFHTTKTRGTGLGLPISRKIVQGHGGAIRIESTPGAGTVVLVELPR